MDVAINIVRLVHLCSTLCSLGWHAYETAVTNSHNQCFGSIMNEKRSQVKSVEHRLNMGTSVLCSQNKSLTFQQTEHIETASQCLVEHRKLLLFKRYIVVRIIASQTV